MRIFVKIKCESHQRVFEIAVGAGDKTFKWLGLAASQLFAAAAPNGALRRRDEYRGATGNVEQHAINIVLSDGVSPHPAAQISDYLRDQDSVEITLISTLAVNSLGTPSSSNWATLAFTSTEDHYGMLYDDDNAKVKQTDDDPAIVSMKKAKADFMRIIMRGQMLNEKLRARLLQTAWQKAEVLLPRIKEADALEVQEVLFNDWVVIFEMFTSYAPSGSMDLKEFQRMCEDNNIFSSRDSIVLSSRAFNRIIKVGNIASGTLDIESGTFIASLLVLSQIRLNDIFEKTSTVSAPAALLREILTNNFRVLAVKLSFKCLPKEVLSSVEFLYRLREVYDDLITLFEKYAARNGRDIYTSLPIDNVVELFADSKITEGRDVDLVKSMFKKVKSGAINGRDHDVQPPHPPADYLFPELIEAATLIQFDKDVRRAQLGGTASANVGTKTTGGGNRKPTEEEAAEPKSQYPTVPATVVNVDILTSFTSALQKLSHTLTAQHDEPVKKMYNRTNA